MLHVPEKYIFDEVYHAITAKLIARNDVRAYEWWNPPVEPNTAVDWLHPPLAKYTQAIGILMFGENSFGWRISSVVFGVLVIAAVFKLADVAFDSKPLALTAAALSSLDGLLLVQSRIAMNDIHVTFFILMTVLFYLLYIKRHQPLWLLATGMAAGLAIGSKWSGLYILALVGLFQAGYLISQAWKMSRRKKQAWMGWFQTSVLSVVALVIIPIVLYLAAYSHMFLQGKGWEHFRELHNQIWWYQTTLKATHSYQSRPWEWFLDARPVWYFVEYSGASQIANIYAFGNPLIFWAGGLAVLATIAGLLWQWRMTKQVSFSVVMILASYLIVWLPWQLSPRIMFFYHYTPAVPFMTILTAYWLRKLWRRGWKLPVALGLLFIFLIFILWYPHWTGIPVPIELANRVYFALKSWK
jgi:dolichyl-phosphate-mannose--protein O-mannosyl transferase